MKQLAFFPASLIKISLCVSLLLCSSSYGMQRLRVSPIQAKRVALACALTTAAGSQIRFSHNGSEYDLTSGQNACSTLDFLYGSVINKTHALKALLSDSIQQCSTRTILVDALTNGQAIDNDGDEELGKKSLEAKLHRLDSDLILRAKRLTADFDAAVAAREQSNALVPSKR